MKYMPSIAELIDRLSIAVMKYAHGATAIQEEIDDIVSDLNEHGQPGELIKAITALALVNAFIWLNEDAARQAGEQDTSLLLTTHKLNSDRAAAKARISSLLNQRIDPKLNYHKGHWNIKYD